LHYTAVAMFFLLQEIFFVFECIWGEIGAADLLQYTRRLQKLLYKKEKNNKIKILGYCIHQTD